ncbi:ribonuclease HI family protein [bacterium]|nr:MAG: ribonuclease HI family protein [bacterium]QQR61915.1 MAG: ribonuclease HI family protein [bacterium]
MAHSQQNLQLSLFQEPLQTESTGSYNLFVDGASRGNPGHAGAGIFITCDTQVILKEGFYLYHKTNNQAEYLAFLLGIYHLYKHKLEQNKLIIHSDSLLLVKQLNLEYKITNVELKKLFLIAHNALKNMKHKTLIHVPREENKQADEAANYGIDKKIAVPKEFFDFFMIDHL